MSAPAEFTVPFLPCVSLEETFPFYQALGFEVTYQQKAPYVYGVVQRGGVALHFFGLKGLNPNESYSGCLVVVPEVEGLHRTFAEALRQRYGKLPIAGVPRITRMRPGQGRFTLTDPSGNSLIFIKQQGDDGEKPVEKAAPLSRMARALATVATLRDSKGDDAMAARVLDTALARPDPVAPVERARALAARAELAVALGERTLLQTLRAELQQLALTEEERALLQDELAAADALEKALTPDERTLGESVGGQGGEQMETSQPSDFPANLSKPALLALTGAGYTRLEQLTRTTETELLGLPGMDVKAMDLLRTALAAQGLAFAAPSDFSLTLGKPALRALAVAGYNRLEQLTHVTEAELLALHGMGPKGTRILRAALQAQGLDFAPSKKG